jgi:hypothetical protein
MTEDPEKLMLFHCTQGEVVTIDIAETNTNYLASVATAPYISVVGKRATITLGNSSKTATLSFDFDGNAGEYGLTFNGTLGDGTFQRNVSQPHNTPTSRTYSFSVE